MSAYLVGLKSHSLSRDEDGHRTYDVTWQFRTNSYLDGPEIVLAAVNTLLPPLGSAYAIDNDYDPWAFRTPELSISVHKDAEEGEPTLDWMVNTKYTTKPMARCMYPPIDNPLLEPFTLSGDFVHVSREMKVDKDGKPLRHPNFEPITGPEVEDKVSYPSIAIGFNTGVLPLSTYVLLINKVNDSPLWGLPSRCIRFTDAKWERVLYGSCFYYYKVTYTFECNLETFDKKVPAMGMKIKKEGTLGTKAEDFVVAKDSKGENMDIVFLNASGEAVDKEEDVYIQTLQIPKEANLLLLGIPTTLIP
jgi:hypothetical protein